MKYFYLKVDNKRIFKLLALFIFLVMSNVTVFGQSANNVVDNTITIEGTSNDKKENVSAVSSQSNSMNFVLWFMGTKQDPNGTVSKDNSSKKIQAITSGSAPNRLLIKAFLKKAVEADNMVS